VTPKYHLYLDIMVQAIEKAGSLDTVKVREVLDKTPEWKTLFGISRFTGKDYYGINRQIVTPVYISELQGGKLNNRGVMLPMVQ